VTPPPHPLIPPFPAVPPTPPTAPGAILRTIHKARIEIIAQGDVAAITDADKEAIQSAIALSANVSPSTVSVTVKTASVLIIAEITTPDATGAALVANALSTGLSSPEDATTLLSAASLVVTNAPTIETVVETVLVPRALAPSDNDTGLIAVAVVVPVLVLMGGATLIAHVRSKRTTPRDGPTVQHAERHLDQEELSYENHQVVASPSASADVAGPMTYIYA
jgi:hypothetical protein